MISKRKMPKHKVRVTFTFAAPEGTEQLAVLGDFNNWDGTATPMTHAETHWTAAVTLDMGGEFQFRYFDGKKWFDDETPDGFVVNAHGTRNGLLKLTPDSFPEPKSTKKSKKPA